MNKYQVLDCLGNGTFGQVNRALNLVSNEIVAIKLIQQKYRSYEECLKLREVKALIKLKEHPNIIELKEILFENGQLSLVFEFIQNNIYQMYINEKVDEGTIKNIIKQCARDLKPENILIQNEQIKLIDFGCAREIQSKPPFTDYVATRWYRAPEILLHATTYSAQVDIFALGCIMCELYLGKPIFVGVSEIDQLNKLLTILGTFTAQDWPEGTKLAEGLGVTLGQHPAIPFGQIIKNASLEALNLITQMLKWDPNKRITSSQLLDHKFLEDKSQRTPEFASRPLDKNNNCKLVNMFKQMSFDDKAQQQDKHKQFQQTFNIKKQQ